MTMDNPMMLDALEPRRLLAGTVTVTTSYGSNPQTIVKGDAAANAILVRSVFDNWIEQEDSYEYLAVYGSRLIANGVEIRKGHSDLYTGELSEYDVYREENGDGTTFNVVGSLAFDLGDGDDVLRLDGDQDNAFDNVVVYAGRGNDRVTADGGFASLLIDSGEGDDRVSVIGRDGGNPVFGVNPGGVVGDLNIATGQGKDRISLLGNDYGDKEDLLEIGGRLRIGDNAGATQVNMNNVRVRRAATVALGRSNDTIRLANTVFRGETRFLTREGNDIVRFSGNVVVPNITTALQLGPGGDVFDAERFYADFIG